jgi:hypothetical protein
VIDTPPVPVQLTLNVELGKRWRTSQQRWVVRGTLFDPRRYGVDVLAETPARRFVEARHYSGTWPSALERFGLYRCRVGLPAHFGAPRAHPVPNPASSACSLCSTPACDVTVDGRQGALVLP